jgi:hypothetical protein
MDVPVPESALSALGTLRTELQGELAGLVERRSGLEQELQALSLEIESKQGALELVEASERQLVGQERGKGVTEEDDTGASVQVGDSATLLQDTSESV